MLHAYYPDKQLESGAQRFLIHSTEGWTRLVRRPGGGMAWRVGAIGRWTPERVTLFRAGVVALGILDASVLNEPILA